MKEFKDKLKKIFPDKKAFLKIIFILGIIFAVLNLSSKFLLLPKFLIFFNFLDIDELIYFSTFLALLWYSWETMEMRKEMKKQTNEIIRQNDPDIRLLYNRDDEKFVLKNFGKNNIYNITIDEIRFDDKNIFSFTPPNFSQTYILNPGYCFDIRIHYQNKETISSSPIDEMPSFKNFVYLKSKEGIKIDFVINYENHRRQKVKRIFKISNMFDNWRRDILIEFNKEEIKNEPNKT